MARPSMAALLRRYGCDISRVVDGWQPVRCPFHDDTTASASFNEGKGKFRCHGCGLSGTVASLLKEMGEVVDLPEAEVGPAPEKAPVKRGGPVLAMIQSAAETYHRDLMEGAGPEVERARLYLQSRGFDADAADAAMLGVVTHPVPGHEGYRGRLAIPYQTNRVGVVGVRFRCLSDHDCKERGCPKYLSLPGSPSRMFEARQVLKAGSLIAVCEGELDTLTMIHQVGIPAVGIPGASNWHEHYPLVLSGFEVVMVLGDGDDAGRKFSRKVASAVENAVEYPLPNGEDVNSLVVKGGAAQLLNAAETFSG